MFSVIQKSNKNHWFPRCGYRLRTVRGGKVQYLLVTLHSEKVHWKRLRQEMENTSRCVVLQKELQLPEESQIQVIDTQPFEYRLMKNAVVELLQHSPISVKETVITLIDLRGVYHDFARILAPFCGKLKIVTLNSFSYQELAAQFLRESGAVFQITDVFQSPNENLMIISPSGFSVDFGGKVSSPIFTMTPECFRNATVVHDFRCFLPKEYITEFPEKLDDMQLLSAIYGFGGKLEVSCMIPDQCTINGKPMTLQQLGQQLFRLDTKPEVAYN